MGGPGTEPELSQQEHLPDKAFPNPLVLAWNKSTPEFSQFKQEVLFSLHIFAVKYFGTAAAAGTWYPTSL